MRHYAPPARRQANSDTIRGFLDGQAPPSAAMPDPEGEAAIQRALMDASDQCIQLIDEDGRLHWMNTAAMHHLEIDDPAPFLGKVWTMLWPAGVRPAVTAAVTTAISGAPAYFEGSAPTATFSERYWEVVLSPIPARDAGPRMLAAVFRDVTERREAVDRLRWAATHDDLTGLANRSRFYDRLEEMLEAASRDGTCLALALFDVDRFKQINDQIGHSGGDALLKEFGLRLGARVPHGGMAARTGGDEFALLMPGLASISDAEQILRPILARLCESFGYAGRAINCGASAGIAVFPDHGRKAAELIRHADTALFASKAEGRGRAASFNQTMRQALQREASAFELAQAVLTKGWIAPHYQPKVDLRTGKLCGFEALLRWRLAGGPIQTPTAIWGALNDRALGPRITDAIFAKVIEDLARWRQDGIALPIAVNASAADFRRDGFAERLLEQLARGGVPPSLIELEMTENVFLGDSAANVAGVLGTLNAAGMRIALDDFGTGYASLSHLKAYPVDVIKIDRSFVRDLATDPDDRAIVSTMINLGSSLSIEVVAEGIENEIQLDFLRTAGCDVGQGFLFARAIPAADVPAFSRIPTLLPPLAATGG
jgi:diguanylate cyclase (GGDEF)-like protein